MNRPFGKMEDKIVGMCWVWLGLRLMLLFDPKRPHLIHIMSHPWAHFQYCTSGISLDLNSSAVSFI